MEQRVAGGAPSPPMRGDESRSANISREKGIEMKNSYISKGRRKPLSSQERERFEGHMAEIFSRLGMDLNMEACRRTPHRWVQALVDMTDGYNGDPNIEVVFK